LKAGLVALLILAVAAVVFMGRSKWWTPLHAASEQHESSAGNTHSDRVRGESISSDESSEKSNNRPSAGTEQPKKTLSAVEIEQVNQLDDEINQHLSVGQWDEARRKQQQILDLCLGALGAGHTDTIAETHELEVFVQAVAHYGPAAGDEPWRKTLNNRDAQRVNKLTDDIKRCLQNGRWQEAREWQQEILDTCRDALGDNHSDTVGARGELDTLDLILAFPNTQRERIQEAYRLGSLAEETKDPNKLLEYHQQQLGIVKEHFGPAHMEVARVSLAQADALEKDAQYRQARQLTAEALLVLREKLGEDHRETAAAYHKAGSLCNEMGDHTKAEEWLREALTRRLRFMGPNHIDTASTYLRLGQSLLAQAENRTDDDAEKGKAQAGDMYRRAYVTARIAERLKTSITDKYPGQIYEDVGDYHLKMGTGHAQRYFREALASYDMWAIDCEARGKAAGARKIREKAAKLRQRRPQDGANAEAMTE
jgi:tetratricopeptide (TPR) repeat protein